MSSELERAESPAGHDADQPDHNGTEDIAPSRAGTHSQVERVPAAAAPSLDHEPEQQLNGARAPQTHKPAEMPSESAPAEVQQQQQPAAPAKNLPAAERPPSTGAEAEGNLDDAPPPQISKTVEMPPESEPVEMPERQPSAPAQVGSSAGMRRGSGGITVQVPASPAQTPASAVLPPSVVRTRAYVLALLVSLKLLTAYDSGAFSVVLGAENGLSAELGLNTAEGGTLGSSVFLGNLFGCLVAGSMYSQYSPKMVTFFGMTCHALFTFMFGLSYSFEFAVMVRFLIGITLAFPVVYSPIWVEAFGPRDRVTTWMALVNAGVPIGTMIGFVVGGLVPANTSLDWRWIFYGKALAMIPVLFILHWINHKLLDAPGSGSASGDGKPNGGGSYVEVGLTLLKMLIKFAKNGLFISNVMALCGLYFVITALQTFITSYLRAPPFNADMNTIVLGFGGTVVTAPVIGVIGGGLIIDHVGGYHKNLKMAMLLQLSWGLAAALLSVVVIFTTTAATFLIAAWVLLAFGGAIVPVATGVLVAAIDETERSAASSVAAMCFNLFGYFAGPLCCGLLASATSLTWGIRATLLFSFVGCIPMANAAYLAHTARLPKPARPEIDANIVSPAVSHPPGPLGTTAA